MNGQGILGAACGWCAKPAVDVVEIEAERLRTLKTSRNKADVCIRQAIVAPVCDDHRHIAAGGGPTVEQIRRKKAADVDQLGMFETAEEPRSAIEGG